MEFINPEAEALTGWSREEAWNKHLDEVFHIVNETNSREPMESPFTKVMRSGAAIATGESHDSDPAGRHGGLLSTTAARRLRSGHGTVRGVVLVFRAIDERRKSEAALQLSHDELLKANEELRQFSYAATHDLQEPLRTIVVFSQLLSSQLQATTG